jgi:hypothetical protein
MGGTLLIEGNKLLPDSAICMGSLSASKIKLEKMENKNRF